MSGKKKSRNKGKAGKIAKKGKGPAPTAPAKKPSAKSDRKDRGAHPSPPPKKETGAAPLWDRLPSWWPLPVFIIIGLFFRFSITVWEPIIYPDSTQYMHLAKEIRSGEIFSSDYKLDEGFIKSRRLPPFYSLLISAFAFSKADLLKVGISVSLVMSLLTLAGAYFAASRIFSRKAGLVASALLMFHPFTLEYASPVLTEATFTAMYMGVIAVSTYALLRPSVKMFALTGVLCVLCYLTRDVGITCTPIVAAGAIIKFGLIDQLAWRRTGALVLVLVMSSLVVMSPYLAHIRLRTGKWGLTVQMPTTSITRQIQTFGGDRFDRDRLRGKEKGTEFLGGEEIEGVAGLIKIAPALVVKTVKNMGAYGKELVQKWGAMVLALIVAGLAGFIRDFTVTRDWQRLFFGAWAAVWIVQLWALYALVTPYMVDARYMYPLMAAGMVLAGHGAVSITRMMTRLIGYNTGEAEGPAEGVNPALTFILPLAAVAFVFIAPLCLDPRMAKEFNAIYDNARGSFIFPLIAAGCVFAVCMTGIVFLLPESWYKSTDSPLRAAMASGGMLALGAVLVSIPNPGPDLLKFLPGLALLGLGFDAGLVAASYTSRSFRSALSFIIPVLLVLSAFGSGLYHYIGLSHRMDKSTAYNKYASGHKQAAMEIKAMDLVPPGQVICSRKPFTAYYLDGSWYLDEEKNESIPKTIPEIEQLIRDDRIDYVVIDSLTTKSLRPALLPLAFGLKPLSGAHIIYSRYFPRFRRVITVYDCHGEGDPWPVRSSAQAHVDKAKDYYKAGQLLFALREAESALELDPENRAAWYIERMVLERFYEISQRKKAPTKLLAPGLVSSLERAATEYARLSPGNSEAQEIAARIRNIARQEERDLEKYRNRHMLESP